MPSASDLVGAGMPYRWAELLARIPDTVTTEANMTDNSGGTASDTIAPAINIAALTDSTSGTTDDTVADVSTAVTGVDGTGNNAASKADVDTRLGTINDNFSEVAEELIAQQALNLVLINAVASLTAKVNTLLTANRGGGLIS